VRNFLALRRATFNEYKLTYKTSLWEPADTSLLLYIMTLSEQSKSYNERMNMNNESEWIGEKSSPAFNAISQKHTEGPEEITKFHRTGQHVLGPNA
jgi:hypothetical protein